MFDAAETIDVDVFEAGLQTSVVPIVFRKNLTELIAQGTAFCVAALENGEAVFATANHVIARLATEHDIEPFILLPRDLDTDEGKRALQAVRVHLCTYTERYGDVALLVVNVKESELPVVHELRRVQLTLRPPLAGENTMALGYPQKGREISYSMTASRGKVEEVHPSRRDSALITFPNFRTSGLYRPGMSGGPIFDVRGRVAGIVSAGTDADDVALVTGYGASTAALAELKVELHTDGGELREFTFVELTQSGVFDVDGDVTLRRTEEGVTLDWDAES